MSRIEEKSLSSESVEYLFRDIAKVITAALEIGQITQVIMEKIELFFKPQNWSLFRVDPTKQELYFVVAKGIDKNLAEKIRFKVGEGVVGQVAKTGCSLLIKDAQNHPDFSNKLDTTSGFTTKSLVAVPIKFNHTVLGVIELINKLEDESFTQRELDLLETIADFSAIALNNAMAYEQLLWAAAHDPLTGVYNRSRLAKLLKSSEQTKITERSSYAIVAVIDINNFKGVNDTYGHLVGDNVLIHTASLLKKYSSDKAFVFRMGGDEFLLVMIDIELNDLPQKFMEINNQLQEDSCKINSGTGFSFGIASGSVSCLNTLIEEADRSMYQRKKASALRSI